MKNWDIMEILFMLGTFYCVFGNITAYLLALRKGLSPSFLFSAYPFHVYRICKKSPEKAGKLATYLALSSSISIFIVVPMAIFYFSS